MAAKFPIRLVNTPATVDALLQVPVSVAIGPNQLSGAPIDCPANVGRVEVRLASSNLPARGRLSLRPGWHRDGTAAQAGLHVSATRSLRKKLGDGTANFTVVETGLTLAVEARTGRPCGGLASEPPARSHRRDRGRELRDGPRLCWWAGDDEHGAVLANVTLYASIRIGNGSPFHRRAVPTQAARTGFRWTDLRRWSKPRPAPQRARCVRRTSTSPRSFRSCLTGVERLRRIPLGDTCSRKEAFPRLRSLSRWSRNSDSADMQITGSSSRFRKGARGFERTLSDSEDSSR